MDVFFAIDMVLVTLMQATWAFVGVRCVSSWVVPCDYQATVVDDRNLLVIGKFVC